MSSKKQLERIFVGIKIPSQFTHSIFKLYSDNINNNTTNNSNNNILDKRYKNCRWVSEDSMHFTITFIGEVTAPTRELIQQSLTKIKFPSFHLLLKNAIETFPPKAKKNIRVLHMPIYSTLLSEEETFIEGFEQQFILSQELNYLKYSIDSLLEDIVSLDEEHENNSEYHKLSEMKFIAEEEEERDGESSVIVKVSVEGHFINNTNNKKVESNNSSGNQSHKDNSHQRHQKNLKHKKKDIFRPHLTLSRVKPYPKVHELHDLINELNEKLQDATLPDYELIWKSMVFPVYSFILFRSNMTKSGSVYEIIQEYPSTDHPEPSLMANKNEIILPADSSMLRTSHSSEIGLSCSNNDEVISKSSTVNAIEHLSPLSSTTVFTKAEKTVVIDVHNKKPGDF